MHARTVRSRICSKAVCLWRSKNGRAPADRRSTAGIVHATTGPWRAAESGPRSVADNRNTPPWSAHPSSCSPPPPLELLIAAVDRSIRAPLCSSIRTSRNKSMSRFPHNRQNRYGASDSGFTIRQCAPYKFAYLLYCIVSAAVYG